MCGGGGGGVEAPDPMKQAEADILAMKQQYRLDNKAATRAAREAAAKEEADRARWQEDLGTARATAQGNIGTAFERAGLSTDDYMDRINAALDLDQQGKSFGGSTSFSTDLGDNILGDIRTSTIRDYQRGINEFAAPGFEDKAFASTSDDAIIDAILNEQYGTASDAILRARDRGTLNDSGFKYAMDNLNTSKTAANSRLQDIGGGILEGYRSNLGSIGEEARNTAGNWDFGVEFDPNVFNDRITTKAGEFSGGLEGDLRNAIGGEQFFDIASLLQKGGVAQGAQNTGLGSQSGSLLGAISQRKENEQKSRGLGTTGSF